MSELGKVERTSRGFEIIDFRDLYDVPCSLQQSSIANREKPGTSAVWLGTDGADAKVLASEAKALGVETAETTGWVPYPIPSEVLLSTRMHLDREQVVALIAHLQNWLDNDTFDIHERSPSQQG